MVIKQNPFSFYDFLGYFTPGAISIYGGILIWKHMNTPLNFQLAMEKLSFGSPELYVPFVLLAYLSGHLFSFVSSFTIERYAICSFGYPSRFLLQLTINKYWDVSNNEKVIRFFIGLSLFPIFILDNTVGRVLFLRDQLCRKLDDELTSIIKKKVESLIKIAGELPNPDTYNLDKDHDFFVLYITMLLKMPKIIYRKCKTM